MSTVGIWSFGLSMFYFTPAEEYSIFWSNFVYFMGSAIAVAFFYVSLTLSDEKSIKKHLAVWPLISLGILFAIYFFTTLMVKGINYPHGVKTFIYGPAHFLFDIHFSALFIWAIFKLFRALKITSGIKREQVKYVLLSTFIGVVFNGMTNVSLPSIFNNCSLVWIGPYITFVMVSIMTYAIVRYKILDVHFVIRRSVVNSTIAICLTGILLPVFLLPQGIMLKSIVVFLSMFLTAMFLPKIKQKTESAITQIFYKGKYKYLNTLEMFIDKMVIIPKEEDLIKQSVQIPSEILIVNKAGIFIYDQLNNNYAMRAHIGLDAIGDYNISGENKLIKWLKQNKEVFIKEEAEKAPENRELMPIKEITDKLGAAICIPAMIEDNLIGFIMLGEKTSGEMYSHIDNRILKRLGNQLAVALNYKRIEAQLRKQEQSAVLAKNRLDVTTSMAYGLADRIRNDLFSIHMFLGELPKMIQQLENRLTVEEKKSLNNHCNLSSGGVNKLIALSKEITNMCKPETHKLNKYEPGVIIDITVEIEEQFKQDIKDKNIKLEKTIEGNPPGTYFDRDGIKNVLFHLLRNSIHAIPETRKGSISVKITGPIANSGREFIRILIEDNGIGIPEENANNIFNPFFTTKGTAGGTGLGLIMSQFIISRHEGHIGILRTVLDKGTTMYVDLPIIKEPPKPEIDYKDILGMFPGRRK